jgi:hypothetical protein
MAEKAAGMHLPSWQVLEFEEKAFWATAKSQLELYPLEGSAKRWNFIANSSVPNNSERVSMILNAQHGQILERERLSFGKEDQRMKTYTYNPDHVLKERREPGESGVKNPREWPLVKVRKLPLPKGTEDMIITNPYLLILQAAALQEEGLERTREILVHTDENFYIARLSTGKGISLKASYRVVGEDAINEQRETIGVVIKVSPAEPLRDKDDFNLLGLSGDIIMFFDKQTGMPLQIRGLAPRIGSTSLNLKSVTMRPPSA